MMTNNLLTLDEAIAIALMQGKNRRASFEAISDYIERRKLYPISDNDIPLVEQIMHHVTRSERQNEHLFEQVASDIIELKNTFNYTAIHLAESLDSYFGPQNQFFHPSPSPVNTINEYGDRKKVKLKANEVVCILAHGKDNFHAGEKKSIYVLEERENSEKKIAIYSANGSLKYFEKLIDPISFFLVVISDRIMVNVSYFEKNRKKVLIPLLDFPEILDLPVLSFSRSTTAKKNEIKFDIIQSQYKGRISFGKNLLNSDS